MKTHAPKISKIQKKEAPRTTDAGVESKIQASDREPAQPWQQPAPNSSLADRLQQQSASVQGIMQLQRAVGNRLTASLLASSQPKPSEAEAAGSTAGALVVQRKLTTTADQFDQDTTIPKSGFFSSESKLGEIVKALTEYESASGSASREVPKLLKIYQLCGSTNSEHKKQMTGMQQLKIEVYQEALNLMPTLVKDKLGIGDPTESLYTSTLNGNSFSGFGITDQEYQDAVLNQTYDLTRVDEAYQAFMATKPALGTKDEDWHTACKKLINQTQKKAITKEAFVQLKTQLNAERKRLLDREDDKKKLQSMFNVTDELDLLSAEPNRVTNKEFAQISDLYSNIREGNSHVKISNQKRDRDRIAKTYTDSDMSKIDAEDFKGKALDDIAKILQTPIGRELLTSLGSGGKTGTSDVTLGHSPVAMDAHQQSSDNTNDSDGTGTGSKVFYKAGTDIALPLQSGNLDTTSDTALFHELVHAYHASQGKIVPRDKVITDLDTIFAHPSVNVSSPVDTTIENQDVGVVEEEHATVGIGWHAGERMSENRYREYHRQLANGNQTEEDKYKHRKSYR